MTFFQNISQRLQEAWHARAVSLKAVSFAFIGVINAAVDYGVFFVALGVLSGSAGAAALAGNVAAACHCLDSERWLIIPSNVIAWAVAVTGSYVMNSYTTFAVESGGKLSW